MSKPRLRWAALGLVLLVVAVLVGLAGWRAWQINSELNQAITAASRLETALRNGNEPVAEDELASLRLHSARARDSADSFAWGLVGLLPVIGDDARGVATVSEVVAELSEDGLQPLLTTSRNLESLLPRRGRIAPDAVAALQGPVSAASSAFDKADSELAGPRPEDFIARFEIRYRELASRVNEAADALRAADTAVAVLPTMLGAQEEQEYLLVFQNNAEIRSTGGLPGAISLVEAQDGRIRLTRQVAASSFGEASEPVLPLTDAEIAVFQRKLGTFFLDANFTPDFPRAADLMRARWEQVYEEDLDGVITLDVVAISYILEATGPVDVDGRRLTPANVVDELLHQVYLRFEDPVRQDEFFRKVARVVFDRVSTGIEDPERLARALSRAAAERRILVHSFDAEVQAVLAGTQVAGGVETEAGDGPEVGVYLNDGTGSKMSYFLRYDTRVSANYCVDGQQGLTGHATLRSLAPRGAAALPRYITGGGFFGTDPGEQTVFLRLYGPVGGQISQIRSGADLLDPEVVELGGRPVTSVALTLGPQSTTDLTWRMVGGKGQTGDVHVAVTPGIEPGGESFNVRSACG